MGRLDSAALPTVVAISTLSLAELATGPPTATHDIMRASRRARLQFIAANVEALPFDSACAYAYGTVYASVVGIGRKPRGARAVDLMIAATALAHRLPLYTLNPKDLRGLEGLIEIVDLCA